MFPKTALTKLTTPAIIRNQPNIISIIEPIIILFFIERKWQTFICHFLWVDYLKIKCLSSRTPVTRNPIMNMITQSTNGNG